jgi:hypothetical protein
MAPQWAQYLIAGLIVLLAALYAASKYLPKAWRQRLVYRLSARNGKGKLVQWLDTDSSCGSGCDTCGSCAPTPSMPEQDEKGRKVIRLHVER